MRPTKTITVHPPKPNEVVSYLAFAMLLGGAYVAERPDLYFPIVGVFSATLFLIYMAKPAQITAPVLIFIVLLATAPVFASLVVNGGEQIRFFAVIALALVSISSYLFGTRITSREISLIQSRAPIISLGLAVLAALLHGWGMISAIASGGRVHTAMHPNLFGLIALSIFTCVVSSRNFKVVLATFLGSFFFALAANSRSSLLAILLLLGIRIGETVFKSRAAFVRNAPLVGLILVGAVLAGGLTFLGDAFQVNNQYRGVSSGFSGRTDIWQTYFNLWIAHPFLGIGPGRNLVFGGIEYYAHNQILEILAETGLIGFVSFYILMIWGAASSFRTPLQAFTLYAVASYLVYGIFEGRGFNVGNPLSALYFFSICAAIGAKQRYIRAPQIKVDRTRKPSASGPH